MKKTFLLILAVGFFIFAFLGFRAAFKISRQNPTHEQQPTKGVLDGNQRNYLIVHINNLQDEKPGLLSAWAGLVVYTTPPQLMFVPLYPAKDQETSDRLDNVFAIDSAGNLEDRTIQAFRDAYDLDFEGTILVDDTAMNLAKNWSSLSSESDSPQTATTVLGGEQEIFTAVCKIFKKDGARIFLNKVRWSQLLPDHFSTDLSFESLMLALDKFKSSPKLDSCEILLPD